MNIPIQEVATDMSWFLLRCMDINSEFALMTLPRDMNEFLVKNSLWITFIGAMDLQYKE